MFTNSYQPANRQSARDCDNKLGMDDGMSIYQKHKINYFCLPLKRCVSLSHNRSRIQYRSRANQNCTDMLQLLTSNRILYGSCCKWNQIWNHQPPSSSHSERNFRKRCYLTKFSYFIFSFITNWMNVVSWNGQTDFFKRKSSQTKVGKSAIKFRSAALFAEDINKHIF